MRDLKPSIRPTIDIAKAAQSDAEKFQNEVLRPILKMQNELLLAIFKHFLEKRKVKFAGMPNEQRLDWIAHSLRQDNRLRGILLGTVIGHFTLEEWATFQSDESEFRKRITEMMTKRLQDQVGLLV